MKTPSMPYLAALLRTGAVLLATCVITRPASMAQHAPPRALPVATAEPATPVAPPEPTAIHESQPLRLVAPGGPPGLSANASIELGADRLSASSADAPTLPPLSRATHSFHLAQAARAGLAAGVADVLLQEESLGSPQEAAHHYEAMLAEFDSQRANAAQAVFRLGETYRKLGRPDEARIQFARILREFVDFPDLAALSQQQLTQNLPRQQMNLTASRNDDAVVARVVQDITQNRDAVPQTSEEERALLREEIRLLERQLAETRPLIDQGLAPFASILPVQREILQLKRQLLRRPADSLAAPPAETTPVIPSAGTIPGASPAPTALPTPTATSVPVADPSALQAK